MKTASSRRSSAKLSVAPRLIGTFVQTFDVDGRHLQTVFETWQGKPKGVESHEDPARPGVFTVAKIYDPIDRTYHLPDESLNPPVKASA